MVPLRRIQGIQKFPPIETDGIAKGFKIRPGDFDLDAFFVFFVTLASRVCAMQNLLLMIKLPHRTVFIKNTIGTSGSSLYDAPWLPAGRAI